MTTKIFLTILLFAACGCHNTKFKNKIVINGNFESHINGEIYLFDIAKKDIIKDSTKVIDGQFNFTYKSPSSFSPFEASLCMWDRFQGIKYLRPIGFINPYLKNNIESEFYVDRGLTSIDNKTEVGSNHYCYEIQGSKQNEPYFKHLELSDLNQNQSAAERKRKIANDLSLIIKYPYSFYMLNTLYINREQYTCDELKLLMAGFNEEAKAFVPYYKLKAWLEYKKGKPYLTDIILENNKGGKERVFSDTAQITMLVFWASWCGPCRREIPNLKDIYMEYHAKGLAIISISLDNNEKSWQTALANEKMPWRQLITKDSAKNVLDVEYNISTIPVVVLINAKKQVIQRFVGFSTKEEYYKTLSILSKK